MDLFALAFVHYVVRRTLLFLRLMISKCRRLFVRIACLTDVVSACWFLCSCCVQQQQASAQVSWKFSSSQSPAHGEALAGAAAAATATAGKPTAEAAATAARWITWCWHWHVPVDRNDCSSWRVSSSSCWAVQEDGEAAVVPSAHLHRMQYPVQEGCLAPHSFAISHQKCCRSCLHRDMC